MINLLNVTKNFNHSDNVINDFSYAFENKIYQLIGPNGIGKSVLLKIIAGIDRSIEGVVTNDLSERPVLFLSDTGIGVPFLSIKDNILLAAKILNIKIDDQFYQLFKEDTTLLDNFYENSSLGNKNKVGLSLLYSRDDLGLIILDEALNGLDIDSKQSVFKELTRIASHNLCPILVVSHAEDISEYCPNVSKIYLKELLSV